MVCVVKDTQLQEPIFLLDVIPNPSTSVVLPLTYVEQTVPVKDVLIMIQVAIFTVWVQGRDDRVRFFLFSFIHWYFLLTSIAVTF